MQDQDQFLEKARNGVVTVVFKKVGTDEIRRMPCTLNHTLSQGQIPEVFTQPPAADYFVVWCLDRGEWRSFRKDTVIEWYQGDTLVYQDTPSVA